MDEDIAELTSELQILIDPDARQVPPSIDVVKEDVGTIDEAQALLADYFGRPGAPDSVSLIADGSYLGTATRNTLRQSQRRAGDPGPSGDVGVGDGIQLPGASTRYKLLTFACRRCQAEAYRVHYDDRNLPTCPADGQAMELQSAT